VVLHYHDHDVRGRAEGWSDRGNEEKKNSEERGSSRGD
jgi:hypothetical protein